MLSWGFRLKKQRESAKEGREDVKGMASRPFYSVKHILTDSILE
jgi:hypothetical protein